MAQQQSNPLLPEQVIADFLASYALQEVRLMLNNLQDALHGENIIPSEGLANQIQFLDAVENLIVALHVSHDPALSPPPHNSPGHD
jgi:hypothetical protein